VDWGAGAYEQIAAGLLPAARRLVELAAPCEGEQVVDVGCGTGSAALLAAERGAIVTGVDPAERLLEVARTRAGELGLDAGFLAGEAASLPLRDGSAQLVISCFGAIFAPDAPAAAGEMARVAGGRDARIALTAWLPEGALAQAMRARSQALARAGLATGPPRFAWHDPDALRGMFGPLGFSVETHEEALAFTAASPSEFLDGEMRDHPAWIAARAVLEPLGELEPLREQTLAILAAADGDGEGFRITSRYVVAIMRPV
jgi:SAM-dependent methyltransferase